MPIAKPEACSLVAFQALARQIPAIETTNGLLRAAVAICLHEWPEINVAEVERSVWSLAGRVRGRVKGPQRRAILAHLHEELFERQGFRGATENYYSSENSYLPAVLVTKKGIPIALSLLYCVIARRVGLRTDGINAPGHFLVQVFDDTAPILIDPFNAGRSLTRDDAIALVEATSGEKATYQMALRPATHRQWIRRMLHNLMLVFEMQERRGDADAMREMLTLVT